jgi:hypothetical protein
MPLAVAAAKYPNFLNNLKRTPIPARENLGENIQPTKFFVRSGYPTGELSRAEAEVLEVIGEEPVSVPEIKTLIRVLSSLRLMKYFFQNNRITIKINAINRCYICGEKYLTI